MCMKIAVAACSPRLWQSHSEASEVPLELLGWKMGEPEAAAPERTGEVASDHSWSTDALSLVGRQTYHLQLQIYKISARTNWLLGSVMTRLSALEDRALVARCFNFWKPIRVAQDASSAT